MQYRNPTAFLGPVPLKEGERYCYYCQGYGVLPINPRNNITYCDYPKCFSCDGKGKVNK